MAVDQPNSIDLVTTGDGVVTLSVADHLDWANEYWHVEQLQAKLNCYLEFIDSGELVDKFPEAGDQRPCITVHFVYSPTAAARDFLLATASTIEAQGIGFSYDVLPAKPNA
jgi:hypothetical protein